MLGFSCQLTTLRYGFEVLANAECRCVVWQSLPASKERTAPLGSIRKPSKQLTKETSTFYLLKTDLCC